MVLIAQIFKLNTPAYPSFPQECRLRKNQNNLLKFCTLYFKTFTNQKHINYLQHYYFFGVKFVSSIKSKIINHVKIFFYSLFRSRQKTS